MRDCVADCENQIVWDHHQSISLSRLGATKECRPSPQLAADDLRRACWQHAVVCLLAGMKERPNHPAVNMVSSASREAQTPQARDEVEQDLSKLCSSARPLGRMSTSDVHGSSHQRN